MSPGGPMFPRSLAWIPVERAPGLGPGGCHDVAVTGRILLVEDAPTIGKVLTSSLRSHAYEVPWARTGAEGLARTGTGDVDLVLGGRDRVRTGAGRVPSRPRS
jgi:hypothetical protein